MPCQESDNSNNSSNNDNKNCDYNYDYLVITTRDVILLTWIAVS